MASNDGATARLIALAAASIGTLAASAISYGAAIYRAANPNPCAPPAGETADTGDGM